MSRKKSKKTLKRVPINLIALRILKKRADRKEAVKAETLASLKGKNGKKEQVSYLRKTLYKNNNAVLNGMIQKIKDELENFLKNVEFEMMDGHANKKKSNK